MSKQKEDDDFKVMKPSKGTNHLLDPTQVGSQHSLGTDEAKRMTERLAGDKSYDEYVKGTYALGTQDGTKAKISLETVKERQHSKKTERHNVNGNVRGGGPKSTLRTPRKTFSSFGRGVPYSGGVADFFKGQSAGPAIGQTKHFIPLQGMFNMGIAAGPKTLQGLTWNGAFPVINFQQFNTSTAAVPHDTEEED